MRVGWSIQFIVIISGIPSMNIEKVDLNLLVYLCLLYTSDAADERSSVDLGGRRIINKKNQQHSGHPCTL